MMRHLYYDNFSFIACSEANILRSKHATNGFLMFLRDFIVSKYSAQQLTYQSITIGVGKPCFLF